MPVVPMFVVMFYDNFTDHFCLVFTYQYYIQRGPNRLHPIQKNTVGDLARNLSNRARKGVGCFYILKIKQNKNGKSNGKISEKNRQIPSCPSGGESMNRQNWTCAGGVRWSISTDDIQFRILKCTWTVPKGTVAEREYVGTTRLRLRVNSRRSDVGRLRLRVKGKRSDVGRL